MLSSRHAGISGKLPTTSKLALMKKITLISTGILGLALVGLAWWGFAGFLAAGSSGPPPKAQGYAFWIGGIGYLVLLLLKALDGFDFDLNARAFGRRAMHNLKWTIIWLLACFPAAFLFIGFIAPPFILTGSAFAFLSSVLSALKAINNKEIADEH